MAGNTSHYAVKTSVREFGLLVLEGTIEVFSLWQYMVKYLF